MAERFQLRKWYLDGVSDRGEVLIAYWAELSWKSLAVRYASTLLFSEGRLQEASTLRPGAPPVEDEDRLRWTCDGLSVSGTWTGPLQAANGRVLRETGAGQLVWRCVQPLALFRAEVAGRPLAGRGYTECLTLSLAPWQLPIDELRWGRAHCGERSVVWVDWTGPEPLRLVLLDGQEVQGLEVTDERVATAKTRVELSERQALREGPVAGTSVGAVPGIRRALSQAGLLIDEHKWLSTATLEEAGVRVSGTAIHEVVRWR